MLRSGTTLLQSFLTFTQKLRCHAPVTHTKQSRAVFCNLVLGVKNAHIFSDKGQHYGCNIFLALSQPKLQFNCIAPLSSLHHQEKKLEFFSLFKNKIESVYSTNIVTNSKDTLLSIGEMSCQCFLSDQSS